MLIHKFALCKARHQMPDDVTDWIFPENVEDPKDIKGLYETVRGKLKDCEAVDLYVTGLTVCTAEVIRFCAMEFIPLRLFHYDRESGEFYPQVMFNENYCINMKYNMRYNFN